MTDQSRIARIQAGTALMETAAPAALDWFTRREALTVERKSGAQDLVSEADRAVETLIRDTVRASFPDDALLGEEHGTGRGQSGWTWVIDPIDGTASFLHGLRSWSISVALMHGDKVVAGWIAEPCAGRLYHAEAGRGAWLGPRRLTASPATDLSEGLTALGSGDPAYIGGLVTRILSAGGAYQRNGSAALSLAHVAAGHYLGFFEPRLSPWDCAAGLLMVTEAGGACAPHPLTEPAPVLAAAPGVMDALSALVKAPIA